MPRVHLFDPVGPLTDALGDGLTPIRPRWSRTSLPGPGPRSSTPHVPSWAAGWTVTSLLGIGRAAITARPLVGRGVPGRLAPRITAPPGPGPASRPPHDPTRAARTKGERPPSRPGRRDRRGHGAQCKAAPAHGAGTGPRADSERIRRAGPAR